MENSEQKQRFESTYGPSRKSTDSVSTSEKKRKTLLPKLSVSELLAGVISALFLVGGFLLGGFLLLLGIAAAIVFMIWFGLSWFLSPRRTGGRGETLKVRKFGD